MRVFRKTSVQRCPLVVLFIFLVVNTIAMAAQHSHRSPYTGQERREIKSLSAQDVDDLVSGRGWGLAKAAELNGMPGPIHVLEMSTEIELTSEQRTMISGVYGGMRTRAISLGKTLVALESDLNEMFAAMSVDEPMLRAKLTKISETRRDLRFVHLSAHLKTSHVLTPDQVRTYNCLRGYDVHDPCDTIPDGHDPAMWRRHNSCD